MRVNLVHKQKRDNACANCESEHPPLLFLIVYREREENEAKMAAAKTASCMPFMATFPTYLLHKKGPAMLVSIAGRGFAGEASKDGAPPIG